jgi:hypothetical protein
MLPGPYPSPFTAIGTFASELSDPSCEKPASQTTTFNRAGRYEPAPAREQSETTGRVHPLALVLT